MSLVQQGGAADRAGLIQGDVIIQLNGVNMAGMMHAEVIDFLANSKKEPILFTVQMVRRQYSHSIN